MLRNAIVLLTVVMAFSGCERTESQDSPAQTAAAETTVTNTATNTAATAETNTATAAADSEQGSCGGQCGGSSCGESGGACGCNQIPARAPRSVPPDATWTALNVNGMRCGGCAKKIEAAVAVIDGVYDVRADFRNGVVRVASTGEVKDRVAPQIAALGYRVQ